MGSKIFCAGRGSGLGLKKARGQATDLRVLAGRYKGTVLASPHSDRTHPMGAREKNALFNMIQPYLAGAHVLDLFAGSGALGIEALSRGAAAAILVEKSPQIARIAQQNLARVDMDLERGQAKVFAEDALKFARTRPYQAFFDLIFIDPPYDGFLSQKPLNAHAKGLSGGNTLNYRPQNGQNSKNMSKNGSFLTENLDNLEVEEDLAELFLQISTLLAHDGHLVLSSPADLLPFTIDQLAIISTHTYARARLTVYGWDAANS